MKKIDTRLINKAALARVLKTNRTSVSLVCSGKLLNPGLRAKILHVVNAAHKAANEAQLKKSVEKAA